MSKFEEQGFLSLELLTWITENRKKHLDWFDLCEEYNGFAHKLVYEFKPHNKDVRELLVATLYIRSLTNFQGFVVLAERGMLPEARVMLRCLMEALFALRALTKHPELANDYIEQDKRYRLKLLHKIENSSESVRSMANPDELKRLKDSLQSEVSSGDIKEIKTESLAIKAGLADLYNTGYSVLSLSVHSHPRDLERYFDVDEKQQIRTLIYEPSDQDIEKLLFSAIDCMRLSMLSVDDVFDLQIANRLNTSMRKLDDYRSRLPLP